MIRLGVRLGGSINALPKGTMVVRSCTGRVFSKCATLSTLPCRQSHVFPRRSATKMHSSTMSQQSHDLSDKTNWSLVYEGPLSKSVKYVKSFSLTTAAASLIGSPILVYCGKQSVPLAGKLAIAGLLCIVGTSTTVLLHWFTKAYVHRLYFDSTRQVFSAETLSFFGSRQKTEFQVKDIVFPEVEGAFSTFQANGKQFFIHQEMVEAQQVLHFVRESQT